MGRRRAQARRRDRRRRASTSPGWSEKLPQHPDPARRHGPRRIAWASATSALTWSANQQVPEEEQVSEKTMGIAVVFSMVLFAGLFIVLPLFAGGRLDDVSFLPVPPVRRDSCGSRCSSATCGDRRSSPTSGACSSTTAPSTRRSPRTRTTSSSRPSRRDQFTTAHVRCGTNFLLTVMVVAIFVYSFIPTPNLFAVIASRIVLIPVIAGSRYEVIRLAAKNMHRRWVRVLMKPGPVAAEAHDARARPRPARSCDRVAARRAHRRTARRGRGAAGARSRILHGHPRTRLVSRSAGHTEHTDA